MEVYDSCEQYRRAVNSSPDLMKLSRTPLALSLLAAVLPDITNSRNLQHDGRCVHGAENNYRITSFDVYHAFQRKIALNELESVLSNDTSAALRLEQFYDAHSDLPDQERLTWRERILSDGKRFHAACCWRMLTKRQLKLDQNELLELFEGATCRRQLDPGIVKVLAKLAPLSVYQR